jgi:hypothetical protein
LVQTVTLSAGEHQILEAMDVQSSAPTSDRTVRGIAARAEIPVGEVRRALLKLEGRGRVIRLHDVRLGEIWTMLGAGSDALHAES